MDKISKRAEFLQKHFDFLVSERTLEQGVFTPADCEWLVKKLDEIEQRERVGEFAI